MGINTERFMENQEKFCEKCKYVISETDRHGDITYNCGRYPPVIINSSSPALFPRVKPTWVCGEFAY